MYTHYFCLETSLKQIELKYSINIYADTKNKNVYLIYTIIALKK